MTETSNDMKTLFVPVRDGIALETHLFLPDGDGPFPAAYSRTVYSLDFLYDRARGLRDIGIAAVVQYARGHGKSGGELEQSVPIAEDGYDTIDWIVSQPWSNGRVGTFGASALAKNQINLAAMTHSAHKAMSLGVPSWGIQEGLGGAWMYAQVMMWIARTQNGPYNLEMEKIDWQAHLDRLPVTSALDDVGTAQSYYQEIITSDFSNWSPRTGIAAIPDMNIPAYLITGWWDLCQYGSVAYYQHLRRDGRESQRNNTHLIIGPWNHLYELSEDYDFGPAADYSLDELENTFFSKYLKGCDTDDFPPVHVFILGDNQWRRFSEWPVPEAKIEKWYLHDGGILTADTPASPDACSAFLYNPANPIPTSGGANNAPAIRHLPAMGAGPRNQYHLCQREDVVVFRTAPANRPQTIAGPVEMVLWAASSAVDTDFTAKLMLVNETGDDWMLLSDGIVRARYRNGRRQAEFLSPGNAYEFKIDLWHVAVTIQPGCSLALAISSSNFPRFCRNLNTGGDNEQDDYFETASQTILHNSRFASHLVVPVLD
ncbi:MAG: CocE/NonD family hydrolase [Desulfobacteraceae bacterium]|nr:CocE/NonD family hydrolase [Desulfobacteraceae bacterium]